MNTKVAFPAPAGFQYSMLKRLALACLALGLTLASTAFAQEDDSDQPPRWKPRTAKRQYPDDELPSRSVATSFDAPATTPPLPAQIDSPSNQPAAKRKHSAVAAAVDDAPAENTGEPIPASRGSHAHAAPPARPFDGGDDGMPSMQPREPGDGCANGCANGCDEGDCGLCIGGMGNDRVWFKGEALLWWLKGGQTPPLLTTSPASTPLAQAGVLGQPNTTILFGDQELNPGLHAGAKLSFGLWLDNCDMSGLEFSYMILGENTDAFNSSSTGIPILARPFFNTASGIEDSHVIAFPNTAGGTFTASSTENFEGAEALWRRAIVHGCDGRIDMLLGYRFNRLSDGLSISDSVTSSGTAGVAPAGTTINVADTFHTQNDFNGGELGFSTEWRRNRWTLDTLLKVGIGATHSQVLINGATAVIAQGTTTVGVGGLLALPSNEGYHDSNQFSMMPEIGFTVGYDFTPRVKATFGYTMLYWSNVARPGDQIDLNLDPAQFPPATAIGEKPAYALHTSDFWAQGVNLGLSYTF